MKHLSLLIISFLIFSFTTKAQTGSVQGTIVDTASKKSLGNATISVVFAKDSALVSFARSSNDGSFTVGKLENNSYLLMVSYIGFGEIAKPFTITDAEKIANVGIIPMTSNADLGAVIVTAAPVTIKGDTIEYNAGSFKTKPNAAVEDLLKKLPGVVVESDGTIKANGQEIKRIMVDGKMFFADDPKLASKNLQANMVNKVQVFDKKSDKSDFTGFDDGSSEPTINLTLKADKRVGIFGKVYGGYGTDNRYDAGANLNSFKKGEQISFVGQLNNVNQQGFSNRDFLGGGGNFSNNGQGLTTTRTAGLNYNNFKSSKLDLTSSYFFNNTELENQTQTFRQTQIRNTKVGTQPGDSTGQQLMTRPGSSERINNNHRINVAADWKIDSNNSLKISPSVTFQNTQNTTRNSFNTIDNKGIFVSDGMTNNNTENDGFNFSTTALYRHKFSKKGRTLSAEFKIGNSENNSNGKQYSLTNSADSAGNIIRRDTVNQVNNTTSGSDNYSVNISYSEPVSRRAIMEFSGYHNRNNSNSNRETFNFNNATGKYDLKSVAQSNIFDNHFTNSGFGLNYRENQKTWNYALGAAIQRTELQSLLQNKNTPVSQTFYNIVPNAQLQIKPNNYQNFRLNYRGSNNQPSVTQLQPVVDSTDIFNIKVGNPNLKQEFNNNIGINYRIFDPYTQKSFFINFNASQTFNKIVNIDSISSVSRKTTYNNVQGVYNLSANVTNGFPIMIAGIKANLNLSTNASFSNNIAFLNQQNLILKNIIKNLGLGENASINYTFKELFDISLGGNINWTRATYSAQSTQNTSFFSYGANLDNNIYIPGGFTLSNNVNYIANTGRTAGFNTKYTLWNASLAKSFLKDKKGELKLSVNDLLNQNTGITRNTTSNYVEDVTYTVLKRYFMLTFTYNLSKFGGGGMPGMRMGGGGGRGRM